MGERLRGEGTGENREGGQGMRGLRAEGVEEGDRE